MYNEREWTMRQLKTFETSAGFMLAFLPTKEQWEYSAKMKMETGKNDLQSDLVYKACESLKESEAHVVCVLAPLEDR